MANAVKFVVTTDAKFKALATPDANTLYFTSDTEDIYKGSTKYTGGVVTYATTRPSTGIEGRLYVDTTGTTGASIYSGSTWIQVATSKVATTVLVDGVATTDAVSGAAVKSYIEGLALANSKDVITTLSYDETNKALTYTKNGATNSLPITKLAAALAYDGATGKLTIKDSAGTELSSATIPLDNFVKSGTYNATTKALELTMQNASVVSIPAADLVAIYSATDTSTVDLTIENTATGNVISATVKVSATANNAVVANSDGLFVNSAAIVSTAKTVGATTDSGKIVVVDADGKTAVGTIVASDIAKTADVEAASTAWTTI